MPIIKLIFFKLVIYKNRYHVLKKKKRKAKFFFQEKVWNLKQKLVIKDLERVKVFPYYTSNQETDSSEQGEGVTYLRKGRLNI